MQNQRNYHFTHCSVYSACIIGTAEGISDSIFRHLSSSNKLLIDEPSPFPQLDTVLEYTPYLHEQWLIPGVFTQLSMEISHASIQKNIISFNVSQSWTSVGERIKEYESRGSSCSHLLSEQLHCDLTAFQATMESRI